MRGSVSLWFQFALPWGVSHTHCQCICPLLRNVYLFGSFLHFKLDYLFNWHWSVKGNYICRLCDFLKTMVSLLGQDKSEKCWKTSIRIYETRTFCWYFVSNMIHNQLVRFSFTLLSTLVPLSERIINIKRSSIIAHPLLIIIHHNLLIRVPQIIFITYNVAEKWTHDSIFNFWAWSTDFKIKYWANQRNYEAEMAFFFLTENFIFTIYQVNNFKKKSQIYSHQNSIWMSLL